MVVAGAKPYTFSELKGALQTLFVPCEMLVGTQGHEVISMDHHCDLAIRVENYCGASFAALETHLN